jgi:microcystin-dependent protein
MKSHLRSAGWFLAFVAVAFLNFGPGWTARNGSGVYTTPNAFTAGTTITASSFNENFTDIANEITNSVAADGQTTMTGPLKAASGTVAAPGITFGSDTDSGLYRIGANNIGVAVNGAKVIDVATTGATITGTLDATTITQGGAALIPPGTMMPYAGSTAPTGYLLAYGQAVSRTTYADLFTAIGTTYGSGDGSTTFNLPDLRGRYPAGDDDMGGVAANRITNAVSGITASTLGNTVDNQSTTLAQANLPNATLSVSGTASQSITATTGGAQAWYLNGSVAGSSTSLGSSGAANVYTTGQFAVSDAISVNATVSATTSSINGGVTQTAFSRIPPTIILSYIIKI